MTTTAIRSGVLAALLAATALAASANEIDFDGRTGTTSLTTKPAATFIAKDTYASLYGIRFGRANVSAGSVIYTGGDGALTYDKNGNAPANGDGTANVNGVCGLDANGSIVSNCTGDQYFSFNLSAPSWTPAVTKNLSFLIGDNGPDIDSWIINVYGMNDQLLEARIVSSATFTLQTFTETNINRVQIHWTGTVPGGYFLDTIKFDDPTLPARVPEPATLALFGLGLAGLVARRKRRA